MFTEMATLQVVRVATVLILSCSISVLSAESDLFDPKFLVWLKEHKELAKHVDMAKVHQNWLDNDRYLQEQNSLGLPYTVKNVTHKKINDISKVPISVDWRTKNVVPPVVNEDMYGYSKAFAVVHAIDAYWAIKHKEPVVRASVREFINCCKKESFSYQCVVDIGGLASAEDYPENATECLREKYKPIITIKGGAYIKPGDEQALLEAVAQQPVAVTVDAGRPSFEMYQSGVYSSSTCSKEKLNHMMLVVGYGTTEQGVDYWICQNFWGTFWGMKGYILIERNVNMCGIASLASYPV